jgi:8-oxo-dGTP pyrophosphatase MutT (NUDIX family)
MQRINLVKAIVKYTPYNFSRDFVQAGSNRVHSARYLLLQKAKDKFFPENIGKWEFCGGLVKKIENSRQAITREMTEETGLKKEEFRIVNQLPTKTMKDEKYESICDVYLIDVVSMNVKLSSEHSDYKWVKAEDVQKQDLVLYADLLLEFFNNPEKYLS